MSRVFKGYRIIFEVESSTPFYEFTGLVTKTLVYALAPELQGIRRIKGIVSPLHISPLFTIKDAYHLGDPVIPVVERKEDGTEEVKPVELNGEYLFHVGGEAHIVDHVVSKLSELKERLAIKIGPVIVYYKINEIYDITREVLDKASLLEDRVTLFFKSPAQIFNVFTPGKINKFTPSAVEILMVPFALLKGQYTISQQLVMEAFPVLGSLVETWYSLRTLRPVLVPFKGKPQMLLAGHVTYIIESRNRRIRDEIARIIAYSEILGVGRSRQNGFGTVTFVARNR
jgi:hypothetical protein